MNGTTQVTTEDSSASVMTDPQWDVLEYDAQQVTCFPSQHEVNHAARRIAAARAVPFLPEHHAYLLKIAPGTIAVATRAGYEYDMTNEDPRWCERGSITEWSRKSRARMVRTIAELDMSPWDSDSGTFALITLTLPDQWAEITPTGKDFRRLLDRMRQRLKGRAGVTRVIWKLEFQERGAPHWHALMKIPAMVGTQTFEDWLRVAWASVVDVPGALERRKHEAHGADVTMAGTWCSTPRGVSVYFLKHSAKTSDGKEYQHTVPLQWRADGAGPGRFWGVWGLTRAVATVVVSREDFYATRRMMRGVQRGRDARMAIIRAHAQGLAAVNFPRLRRRALADSAGGGWVLVNDGVNLALTIGRMLALRDQSSRPRNLRRIEGTPQVVLRNVAYTSAGVRVSGVRRT